MKVVNSGAQEGEGQIVNSRYSIVMATAKRARQIIGGDDPMVSMKTGMKPLSAAVEELKEKGFSFNMDTAAYTDEGKIKNVYLDGEFGGFAIHIMQK